MCLIYNVAESADPALFHSPKSSNQQWEVSLQMFLLITRAYILVRSKGVTLLRQTLYISDGETMDFQSVGPESF